MRNKIIASVEFYFKGEQHTPEVTIDLDILMANHQSSHDRWMSIYHLLARENGIDTYSYQFEIMQVEKIQFRDATGISAEYLRGGQFFIAEFENAWQERNILENIQLIAKQHLAINDLSHHPELKAALFEAYKLGTNQGKN